LGSDGLQQVSYVVPAVVARTVLRRQSGGGNVRCGPVIVLWFCARKNVLIVMGRFIKECASRPKLSCSLF